MLIQTKREKKKTKPEHIDTFTGDLEGHSICKYIYNDAGNIKKRCTQKHIYTQHTDKISIYKFQSTHLV